MVNLIKRLLSFFHNLIIPQETPDVTAVTSQNQLSTTLNPIVNQSISNNQPKSDLLTAFCTAIQNYEGKPGDLNYRNCNPGNIRGMNGQFLKFKTMAEGFAYLKDYVVRAATDKHFPYKSTDTLPEYFAIYSPTLDHNNPQLYAETIAKEIGVDINTFTIAQLVG